MALIKLEEEAAAHSQKEHSADEKLVKNLQNGAPPSRVIEYR